MPINGIVGGTIDFYASRPQNNNPMLRAYQQLSEEEEVSYLLYSYFVNFMLLVGGIPVFLPAMMRFLRPTRRNHKPKKKS